MAWVRHRVTAEVEDEGFVRLDNADATAPNNGDNRVTEEVEERVFESAKGK